MEKLGNLVRYSIVIDNVDIVDAFMLEEDIHEVLGLPDIKVSKGYYPQEYVIHSSNWENFKALVGWLQEGKYIE